MSNKQLSFVPQRCLYPIEIWTICSLPVFVIRMLHLVQALESFRLHVEDLSES